MATTFGIFQSDIIIRTALETALRDLRVNNWLLDYVFASLGQDQLTFQSFGKGEIERAKKWFMTTDIPVILTPRIDEAKMPCISIALEDSGETGETTLADIHYETDLDIDQNTPLAGPLTPIGYNASIGQILVRDIDLNGLFVVPGMLIMDRNGNRFPILDIHDSNGTSSAIFIAIDSLTDLTNATIVGQSPMFKLPLESTEMKESYNIGCHVNTELTHLLYLHSIVVFILLRYKQRLFEARGFEMSSVGSGGIQASDGETELVYERYVSLSGKVRQYWPKDLVPTIQSFNVIPAISGVPHSLNPDVDSWIGDMDTLGTFGQ